MHRKKTRSQLGFTLIEMMIVVGIVAILSAIGIPAYQNYLQKAALTDMLMASVPYRTSVELCAVERGDITSCNLGSNGISTGRGSRYVASITVAGGVITLTGTESLSGLSVVLTPQWKNQEGYMLWQRTCSGDNASLVTNCQDVFRLDNNKGRIEINKGLLK